jgi:hypothetical protein
MYEVKHNPSASSITKPFHKAWLAKRMSFLDNSIEPSNDLAHLHLQTLMRLQYQAHVAMCVNGVIMSICHNTSTFGFFMKDHLTPHECFGPISKKKTCWTIFDSMNIFWIKKECSFVLFWTWYEEKNAFQSLNVQEDLKWTCKLIRTWVTIYILSIYIKL